MAYSSGEMLVWLVRERGIEPHIPVIDKSKRTDGTFSREDFACDVETDVYICPAGKELRWSRRNFQIIRDEPEDTSLVKYGAVKADCEACRLRDQCCPRGTPRRIMRSEHEGARQMARDIAKTEEYAVSCKLPKKVEMLFAHLNRILGLRQLRLRSPCGANDEFLLAPHRTSESSQRWCHSRCENRDWQTQPHIRRQTTGFFNTIRTKLLFSSVAFWSALRTHADHWNRLAHGLDQPFGVWQIEA